MLRPPVSACARLIPVAASVVAAALLAGTGLVTAYSPVLAQATIRFDEGDEIERFVKENVTAGVSVGAPVVASGGTGSVAYSLSGADAASFSINGATGQILVGRGASIDYESGKTTYWLVVTATDQSSQTASAVVAVVVEDINEPPEIDDAGISFESFEVKENAPADTNIGNPISAVDPEGDGVTYSLAGAAAGQFTVDASSGQVKTKGPLNFEARSSYKVRFVASEDSGSGKSTSLDLTIKVLDDDTEAPGTPNEPTVSPDSEDGHEALLVRWTAPKNPGPPITGYVVQYRAGGQGIKWEQAAVDGGITETTISGLEADTAYEVQVRADNDEGEGNWSEPGKGSTFAAQPVNAPPEFDENAARTLSIAENSQPGTDIGTPFAASDEDRLDTLTYSLGGADSGYFAVDDSTGQISVGPGAVLDHESPGDSDADNAYELTVRVTDGKDESGKADTSFDDSVDVTIRVTDVNEPPELPSTSIELVVAENIAGPLPPLTATDPEGHAVAWSLDPSSPDRGGFNLSRDGILAFRAAPNFESPADADRNNAHELIVAATDDGRPAASSRMSLTIRVANVDEPGIVSLSSLGPRIGVTLTAAIADPDGGVTGASWHWTRYSGGQERTIPGATGPSYTPTSADDGSRLQVAVNYADRQGPGKYAVGPATNPVGGGPNSPPAFTAIGRVSRQVAENTAPGVDVGDPVAATDPDQDVLKYSLSGGDAGAFEIDGKSGQIRTKDRLDYERKPEYRLTVRAADPGGLAVRVEITVTVTDVDTEAPGRPDAPSFKSNRLDPTGSINVEWEVPANAGPRITRYVLRYRLEDSVDDWSEVVIEGTAEKSTISGLQAGTAYEAQVHAVNAEGTGEWSESGFGRTLSSAPANTPPEFVESVAIALSVNENSPGGTPVGGAIRATDLEDDELAFSLAGADSGVFVVNATTGQIRTAGIAQFDFEAPADLDGDNVYELVLRVMDGKDGDGNADDAIDDEIRVSVSVSNVNEAPEFPPIAVELEITENSPVGTNVGSPVVATDPDSDALTYMLGGVGAGSFSVDAATGQIATKVLLDYEVRNAIELIVRVRDGGNLEAEVTVMIRVLNVNEAPVVESELPDRYVVESGGVDEFVVSTYFRDPDGDDLTYAATSSDSGVARAGMVGAVLALTPIELGVATIKVTAADAEGLAVEQSFVAAVVTEPGGPGGAFPIFPVPPQASGDSPDSEVDRANQLSKIPVIVVPGTVLVAPGEAVVLWTIAFNQLGDPLPASAEGVVCTWSSDGGGAFTPNRTEDACSTTFTAPEEGSGTISVRVTQDETSAIGAAMFEVTSDADSAPGVVAEEVPEIPFPDGVTGSTVSRVDGASISSPGGLSMDIPPGAIGDDYLGAYIKELAASHVDVPADAGFTVGSHAGNFVITNIEGEPIPGFRTQLPVRICLPITQDDLDEASGGIGKIYVVHWAQDGQFLRHPADNDIASLTTCANVDRFSLYFVGLAVEPPAASEEPVSTATPSPKTSPTATPGVTKTPVAGPQPTPAQRTEDDSPTGSMPDPPAAGDPTPTPILPHTGDVAPGAGLALLAMLTAAAVLAIGVTLHWRSRHRT